jgi:nicotinamide mononucleotide adenylyltransferase
MKVVVALFGSFNPPTNGHIGALATATSEIKKLGHIVVKSVMIPVHQSYAKEGLLPSSHRVKMCKLATRKSNYLSVDTFETEQEKYTETIKTLRHLKEEYDATPVIVCGIDLVVSMCDGKSWNPKDVVEIFENYGLFIFSRDDKIVDLNKLSPVSEGNEKLIIIRNENVLGKISSTLVRKTIASGGYVDGFIDQDVYQYIKDNKLYGFKEQNN